LVRQLGLSFLLLLRQAVEGLGHYTPAARALGAFYFLVQREREQLLRRSVVAVGCQ
jgi:hypothetical protein